MSAKLLLGTYRQILFLAMFLAIHWNDIIGNNKLVLLWYSLISRTATVPWRFRHWYLLYVWRFEINFGAFIAKYHLASPPENDRLAVCLVQIIDVMLVLLLTPKIQTTWWITYVKYDYKLTVYCEVEIKLFCADIQRGCKLTLKIEKEILWLLV